MRATQPEKASRSTSASVQASFVALREVKQNVLCLATPAQPRKRAYRAILKVEGINFLLKGREEQIHLADLFGYFLAGLAHPIQILMRIQPLNMASYLNALSFDLESGENASLTPANEALEDTIWWELAQAQRHFLEQLASRRQLLERHFYIVIPADSEARVGEEEGDLAQILAPLLGSKKRKAAEELAFTRAQQQLDMRVGEILRQLNTMGLYASRLGKREIIDLYQSCLHAQQALEYPLHDPLIETAERPFEIQGTSSPLPTPPPDKAALDPEKGSEKATKAKKKRVPLERLEFSQLADLLAPANIHVRPDALLVEDELVRTLVIRGLPRHLGLSWMKPLAELDEPMTVSFFFRPRNSGHIIHQLRRRQYEYNTTVMAMSKGSSVDPNVHVAQGDVSTLIAKLASGEERMLEFAMHIQMRAKNRRELNIREERVKSVLHNMLLLARPANYEHDLAFRSDLPHARNLLGDGFTLPTGALKPFFMFLSNSLIQKNGILEGITPGDEPVMLDWWSPSQRNANRLIVAPSGTGKSYKTKLDLLRAFLLYYRMRIGLGEHADGTPSFQGIIIDPEREYRRLTQVLGGQWIRLAPGSRDHINPFDLPSADQQRAAAEGLGGGTRGDILADKIQQLHALLDILLSDRTALGVGTLSSAEKGLLDRALYATYRRKGITSDPRTHNQPAPLMRDLYAILESQECGPDPTGLTARLQRFVQGSLSGIFDGPTNVELNNNPIVCFDTHDLDGELRAVGIFLITQYVWGMSFGSRIPRQLVVDEMMSLYQYTEGARFLETLFQRARKHFLGVTGLTQHVGLLAQSSIPSNCAVQILMAQEPAALPLVADVFKLTEQEIDLLKRCGKGDALLLTNDKRIFVHFEASELEHTIATTDPRELASWEQDLPLEADGKEEGADTASAPERQEPAPQTTSALAQLAELIHVPVAQDDKGVKEEVPVSDGGA